MSMLATLKETIMPPKSEAQRRAMQAAAHGKSTLGIPKRVGQEFAAADPGGKLPKIKRKQRPSQFTLQKERKP